MQITINTQHIINWFWDIINFIVFLYHSHIVRWAAFWFVITMIALAYYTNYKKNKKSDEEEQKHLEEEKKRLEALLPKIAEAGMKIGAAAAHADKLSTENPAVVCLFGMAMGELERAGEIYTCDGDPEHAERAIANAVAFAEAGLKIAVKARNILDGKGEPPAAPET
jgi:hypothetical protein